MMRKLSSQCGPPHTSNGLQKRHGMTTAALRVLLIFVAVAFCLFIGSSNVVVADTTTALNMIGRITLATSDTSTAANTPMFITNPLFRKSFVAKDGSIYVLAQGTLATTVAANNIASTLLTQGCTLTAAANLITGLTYSKQRIFVFRFSMTGTANSPLVCEWVRPFYSSSDFTIGDLTVEDSTGDVVIAGTNTNHNIVNLEAPCGNITGYSSFVTQLSKTTGVCVRSWSVFQTGSTLNGWPQVSSAAVTSLGNGQLVLTGTIGVTNNRNQISWANNSTLCPDSVLKTSYYDSTLGTSFIVGYVLKLNATGSGTYRCMWVNINSPWTARSKYAYLSPTLIQASADTQTVFVAGTSANFAAFSGCSSQQVTTSYTNSANPSDMFVAALSVADGSCRNFVNFTTPFDERFYDMRLDSRGNLLLSSWIASRSIQGAAITSSSLDLGGSCGSYLIDKATTWSRAYPSTTLQTYDIGLFLVYSSTDLTCNSAAFVPATIGSAMLEDPKNAGQYLITGRINRDANVPIGDDNSCVSSSQFDQDSNLIPQYRSFIARITMPWAGQLVCKQALYADVSVSSRTAYGNTLTQTMSAAKTNFNSFYLVFSMYASSKGTFSIFNGNNRFTDNSITELKPFFVVTSLYPCSNYSLPDGSCVTTCPATKAPNVVTKVCEDAKCYGVVYSDSGVCSGRGSCVGTDTCQCNDPTSWTGSKCDVPVCNGIAATNTTRVCHGKGVCIAPNNCTNCTNSAGNDCQYSTCFGVSSQDQANVCSGNGRCVAVDKCVCNQDWYGAQCDVTTCFGIFSNDTAWSFCSGHGRCIAPNNCTCFRNFVGANCDTCTEGRSGAGCSEYSCFGHSVALDYPMPGYSAGCSQHGTCIDPDTCDCTFPYSGANCSEREVYCYNFKSTDPKACGSHGDCIGENSCACYNDDIRGHWVGAYCDRCADGWTGPNCTEWKCFGVSYMDPSVCGNGKGTCNRNGTCINCVPNYSGPECRWPACFGLYGTDACYNSIGGGYCETPGVCKCYNGISPPGTDCAPKCGDTAFNDPQVCNSHGTCVLVNAGLRRWACQCRDGYTGGTCSNEPSWTCGGIDRKATNRVCSGHGVCQPVVLSNGTYASVGTCNCTAGWQNQTCNTPQCFGYSVGDIRGCGPHGTCVGANRCRCDADNVKGFWAGPQCGECKPGFSGIDCTTPNCTREATCNNHGNCVNNNCVCDSAFAGTYCAACAGGRYGTVNRPCYLLPDASKVECHDNGFYEADDDNWGICRCYNDTVNGFRSQNTTKCVGGCSPNWYGDHCLWYAADTFTSQDLSTFVGTYSSEYASTKFGLKRLTCKDIIKNFDVLGDGASCKISAPATDPNGPITTLTITPTVAVPLSTKLLMWMGNGSVPTTPLREVSLVIYTSALPMAVITAQSIIGACDNFKADAFASQNLGAFAATYAWTVEAAPDEAARSSIQAALDGQNVDQRAKTIFIPSDSLSIGVNYTIGLVVTSFAGSQSDKTTFTFSKSSRNIPTVRLSGLTYLTANADQNLKVETSFCSAAVAKQLQPKLVYTFTQDSADTFPLQRSNKIQDNSRLRIIPGWPINSGDSGQFSFRVTVTQVDDPSWSVTSDVFTFTVKLGELTLKPVGGLRRVLPAGQSMTISVGVIDYTGITDSTTWCEWSCFDCMYQDTFKVETAPEVSQYAGVTAITIPKNSLTANDDSGIPYNIEVTCHKRTKTATVTIPLDVSSSTEIPSFSVNLSRNQAGTTLYISPRDLVSATPINSSVIICPTEANCDSTAVRKSLGNYAIDISYLPGGRTFQFGLQLFNNQNRNSATAYIEYTTPIPIKVGTITASPTTGDQTTKFSFVCDGWDSGDVTNPLYYSVQVYNPDTNQWETIRTGQTRNTFYNVMLTSGTNQIRAFVGNSVGIAAQSAAINVTVTQVTLTAEQTQVELDNFIANAQDADPYYMQSILKRMQASGDFKQNNRPLSRALLSVDAIDSAIIILNVTLYQVNDLISNTTADAPTMDKFEQRMSIVNTAVMGSASAGCNQQIVDYCVTIMEKIVKFIAVDKKLSGEPPLSSNLLDNLERSGLELLRLSRYDYVVFDSNTTKLDYINRVKSVLTIVMSDAKTQVTLGDTLSVLDYSAASVILALNYAFESSSKMVSSGDSSIKVVLPGNMISLLNVTSTSNVVVQLSGYNNNAWMPSGVELDPQVIYTNISTGITTVSIIVDGTTMSNENIIPDVVSDAMLVTIPATINVNMIPPGFPYYNASSLTKVYSVPLCLQWSDSLQTWLTANETTCTAVSANANSVTCSCANTITGAFAARFESVGQNVDDQNGGGDDGNTDINNVLQNLQPDAEPTTATIGGTQFTVAVFSNAKINNQTTITVTVGQTQVILPASFGSFLQGLLNSLSLGNANIGFVASTVNSTLGLAGSDATLGQQMLPEGAITFSLAISAVAGPNVTQLSIQNLDDPIKFTVQIEGTGASSYTLMSTITAVYGLPQCTYLDTDTNTWSTAGVTTVSVEEGAGYSNKTGEGLLFTLNCATTHLTTFAPVMMPAVVTNWATLYYATITFGIGCICMILFVLMDLLGVAIFCARRNKANPFDSLGQGLIARLLQQIIMHHMWFSVPAAVALGLVGKEPLLRKYRILAIWWCSICAYAIGTVGIMGSLRIYWNWQGHTGTGDLLNRDLYTILAVYWAPVLVTSLVAGKGIHLLASWLFNRFTGGIQLTNKPTTMMTTSNVIVKIIRKLSVEPFLTEAGKLQTVLTVNYAANFVLFAMAALFVTAMYIVMIIIGVRFLIIQGAFFILVTLFALLVDAIILDPIYILGSLVVRQFVHDLTKATAKANTQQSTADNQEQHFELEVSSTMADEHNPPSEQYTEKSISSAPEPTAVQATRCC